MSFRSTAKVVSSRLKGPGGPHCRCCSGDKRGHFKRIVIRDARRADTKFHIREGVEDLEEK